PADPSRLANIKGVQGKYHYVVDPHTAGGVKAAQEAQAEHTIETPIIVLETALAVKVAKNIEGAIGQAPETPERFAHIMDADRFVTDLPNDVGAVKDFITSSIKTTEV